MRPHRRTPLAGRVVAPWVRTRLRVAPGVAVGLAVLVAVTAFLAAACPLAVDRSEDVGLRRAVADAEARRTTVQVTAPPLDPGFPRERRESALRPDVLRRQYATVLGEVRRPLTADRTQSSYGAVTSTPLEVPDAGLSRPSGLPPRVVLAAQDDLAGHARLRSGRLPRATGTITATTGAVEAAVTTGTAAHLRIEVGSVLHVPGAERAPLAVRVTGIVAPRQSDGAYWGAQPLLHSPSLVRDGNSPDAPTYWLGALLLPPEAAPAMLGTPGNPWRYWQVAPDTSRTPAHALPALRSAVAALESGPGLGRIRDAVDPAADAETDLDGVLDDYDGLRSRIAPLVSVAAFGTGTVAVAVLLMAGGLAADRRRAELGLLRARGASLPGLAGRLLAETAAVALPAGALGLAAALWAVPHGRSAYAVAAAGAVTLLACVTLPLRAVVRHRTAHLGTARADVVSVRPSRRRTIAELTLLVLAAGAVEALRRRGTSQGAGTRGDALVSLAPVLVGVIAALVLVRLHPLPLRLLTRATNRLRGAVGPLALARASRTSVSAVLPLLALLTALTTAAFGGSVTAGIGAARDHAALLTTGADARVESTSALRAGAAERVRRAPGVEEVTTAAVTWEAKPHDGPESVPLAAVSPSAYARLAGRLHLGAFPAHTLTPSPTARTSQSSSTPGSSNSPDSPGSSGSGGSSDPTDSGPAPLPALASPTVAHRYGTAPFPVLLADGSHVTVRITLVRGATPAVPGTEFLVVDRSGLPPAATRPTALLVTGTHLGAAALRRAAGDSPSVKIRARERAAYAHSPLQAGAEHLYTAAVVAGAGYAVLALLLALVRAAPERTALLARLRTMGLTRAQGRRLLILESLPQAVLAAAGGTLTGWAAVRLLSPGIDLTTLALATPGAADVGHLRTDPASLLLPALAVLLLTVAVAALQAWVTGRRGSVRELRAGERA
ncbi:FtsX-like permease family protein [Streptomyces sp. B3I8]|uniref:FtsX-like permease family protein n=1 Tax=Streptomyces sp. B3I8 TaxID=3042303 RepID=UPI00277FE000|nr:FtsX-like permease family protein [Streptomyces sp. B3I8]MDQ0787037.1 putative ABC transport system permease protein [Streptomyces sp. B3I8]